ncbi:glycerophosphocholine phosphodiesterase GPCPD1-like isoform X2 [Tubulanus polymorphus]|uniref:glycerophosphocholine phosphodiesterase GPCPD1-like isoform X2 n=1 Tax=Tubulanus polymorphus TaxID=672921 RepID=UPI003DA5B082
MMQQTIPVLFRVRIDTQPNEVVCVVGDCDELGNWDPHCAVELGRDHRSHQSEIWSREIRVKSADIKYRYFTCFLKQPDNEDDKQVDVMITRWETNIRPRRFHAFGIAGNSSDYEQESGAAIFGRYDGRQKIGKGWLTGQTEIQLRLYNNPIVMWKQSRKRQRYQVACKTMDLRYTDVSMELDDEDSHDQILSPRTEQNVQISVLNSDFNEDLVTPRTAPQFGTLYNEGDFFIFKAQSFEPDNMGFTFNFYEESAEGSTDPPRHVGYAYVLPINMKDTQNIRSIPIHGVRHKPIGQLTVDYLKIKPLKDVDLRNDMSVTYAKHWKQRPSLEVGHRGMGSSYSKECAAVTENTVASLNAAGGHGADYVEFDVQLSADFHPVIYHDFEVCLTLRGKKKKDELQLFKLPVKSLTLDQLHQLQVNHVTALDKENDLHKEDEDPLEHQPFPTLQTCLEQIDPHTGFNVEIKYPMALVDGTHEQSPFFDQNLYVDIILTTLLRYAGNRRIIFSCFEPDICAMLRLKQNRYPVQILTNGWRKRVDLRTSSPLMAAQTALVYDCLGINVNSEVLLNRLHMIQRIKDLGLVLFIWGDELNDPAVIKMFKNEGADGVIYDRISEFKTSDNIFKMEHEAKLQLLAQMGVLTNGSSTSAETVVNSRKLTHSQSEELSFVRTSTLY